MPREWRYERPATVSKRQTACMAAIDFELLFSKMAEVGRSCSEIRGRNFRDRRCTLNRVFETPLNIRKQQRVIRRRGGNQHQIVSRQVFEEDVHGVNVRMIVFQRRESTVFSFAPG